MAPSLLSDISNSLYELWLTLTLLSQHLSAVSETLSPEAPKLNCSHKTATRQKKETLATSILIHFQLLVRLYGFASVSDRRSISQLRGEEEEESGSILIIKQVSWMNILCEMAAAVCSLHKLMSQQMQPSHKFHLYRLFVDQKHLRKKKKKCFSFFKYYKWQSLGFFWRDLIWFCLLPLKKLLCKASYIKKAIFDATQDLSNERKFKAIFTTKLSWEPLGKKYSRKKKHF